MTFPMTLLGYQKAHSGLNEAVKAQHLSASAVLTVSAQMQTSGRFAHACARTE